MTPLALRVAQSNASKIGRNLAVPPDQLSGWGAAAIASSWVAMVCIGNQTGGLDGSATSLLCLALLIFGLPHGSLDIALVRRSLQLSRRQVAAIVMLYLILAGATYSLWSAAPGLALATFLAIACIHFAEDWQADLPPFFAVGTAVALIAAPALLQRRHVADIFGSLTGQADATLTADLLILIAPVALITAGVGVMLMFRSGRPMRALETTAVLCGMVFLPPVLGFAIFFCLAHSPRHLASARAEVRGCDLEVLLLSGVAIAIAALVYQSRAGSIMEDKAAFAAFVTLSTLTVPHMLMPKVVHGWSTRAKNSQSPILKG